MCFGRTLGGTVVVLLALSFLAVSVRGQVDVATADAAIVEARHELAVAYSAVLDAERAGANVSAFLPGLNVAGENVVWAEQCFRDGNYSGAASYAGLALASLGDVAVEASELATSVGFEQKQQSTWVIVSSVFGVVLVAALGFLGWGYVRTHYVRRVLRMKPEVGDHC